jgi:pimeloyl-ACP methyl ester carboxylesterase
MAHATSKDGTRIAFDKTGAGPAVIIVNGALAYRANDGDESLAAALAKDFTVYTYDRRGRGESTDTQPYDVQREIEDIEALIEDAGGTARLYGISSGAALSLRAAASFGKTKILQLALYEPPYSANSEEDKEDFADQRRQLDEVLRTGKRGDAAALFFTAIGTPPEKLEDLRKSREWPLMQSIEHTLKYDYAVIENGAIPVEVAKKATMPALVMNGDKSLDFMNETAKRLSEVMPNAQWKILKDQTHQPSPEILAPVLLRFFKQQE